MKTKYTITFKGRTEVITIQVGYGENGTLQEVGFDANYSTKAVSYCMDRIPLNEGDLDAFRSATIQIEPVPADLSFPIFWEAYGHKIGDKTRTMKLWAALVDTDRVKCLRAIPRYNQFLKQRPNMERLYPETFLKQERFRNEFKV